MSRVLVVPAALAAVSAVSLLACADREVARVDPVPSEVDTWSVRVTPNRDLDILFVIDDSGSMAGEQASLAANFPAFIGVLQTVVGGLPNVHIGVVSSNVGAAGLAGVPGCGGDGDAGRLQVNGCTGLTGDFIRDVSDGRGGRTRNYSGDLDTLFACMAQLGTTGCGFEMHLESMYRALQPGVNPGFRRPGAHLAVIVIADEDDCSADMGAVFGDPTAGVTSPLGPRTSFRCFEFGVECDDDAQPRAFGVKTGCRPRAASPYMVEVERYVEFLKSLETDQGLVMVAGIVGVDDERHTVVVGPDPVTPTSPSVQKSCFLVDPGDPDDGAAPPIRLGAFLRSFPAHRQTSICAPTLEDALRDIARTLEEQIFDLCLRQPLADGDPVTPGPQPQCSVVEVRNRHTADREEVMVPACADLPDARPCWRLAPSPEHCEATAGNPDRLALDVLRDSLPPSDTFLDAQCLVD